LRKWLAVNPAPAVRHYLERVTRPCDEIIVLTVARVELTPGQRSMAKGCATVWAEIETELRRRGVTITAQ
jgi:hypothetical protein